MPPKRVVSLVPSLTESMFDLGLGAAVVGISDFCIHPKGKISVLPRVGGPKSLAVEAVLALQPDLILANREENNREAIEKLLAAGMNVWLRFPLSVVESLTDLRELAGMFQSREALNQVDMLERALEWARAATQGLSPVRYFCPIWMENRAGDDPWWMTFNRHTYMDDLLGLLGGQNVFSRRERRYPLEADLGTASPEPAGERDTRYPRVTLGEIAEAYPDVILLPDEPFSYSQAHIQQIASLLPDIPAVRNKRLAPFEGSLLTWHGTRLGKALQVLPGVLL